MRARVGVASPVEINLGKVAGVRPVAGHDGFENSGSVSSRLIAEESEARPFGSLLRSEAAITQRLFVALNPAPDEILIQGFVEVGCDAHGVVHQTHDSRKRVAKKAGHSHRNVDSR